MVTLNTLNVQFYALLNKINTFADREEVIFSQQKFQELGLNIRERIKVLGANIDLLYQNIDAKIGVIVSQLRQLLNT